MVAQSTFLRLVHKLLAKAAADVADGHLNLAFSYALGRGGLPRDAVATKAGMRGQVAEAWRKVRALDREALGDRMTQAGLDRFHGLKAAEDRLGGIPAEQSAYVAARLSTGLPSITEALLLYGAPKWHGGILTIDPDAPGGEGRRHDGDAPPG